MSFTSTADPKAKQEQQEQQVIDDLDDVFHIHICKM
jgi:hypothetical protein